MLCTCNAAGSAPRTGLHMFGSCTTGPDAVLRRGGGGTSCGTAAGMRRGRGGTPIPPPTPPPPPVSASGMGGGAGRSAGPCARVRAAAAQSHASACGVSSPLCVSGRKTAVRWSNRRDDRRRTCRGRTFGSLLLRPQASGPHLAPDFTFPSTMLLVRNNFAHSTAKRPIRSGLRRN